jgi:two-component system, chemotaxis family, protein-glutamate methylesterase/glutaminase
MTDIRVLIVEDSPTVRHRLCEVLGADPGVRVVGEAADGVEAVDLCRVHQPDVITMDMMLPVMDGVAATEQIMARFPTPILVVSSSTNRAEVLHTCDALAAGAVDVLDKPRGDERIGDWERRLLSAVKLVSRIRVMTHPRPRQVPVPSSPGLDKPPPAAEGCELIVIGASTGGPAAVVETLRPLPARFPVPIALVQHIGAPFAPTFVEWLETQLRRPVRYAVSGEPVAGTAGTVVFAPPDKHLVVRAHRFFVVDGPERHSCRPSVDTLFESVAVDYGRAAVGCLLTGMGRDGASGLLAMHRAGAFTVAQDEATCTVYGMPREAAQLGAASRILPPDEIGRHLAGLTQPVSVPHPASRPTRAAR